MDNLYHFDPDIKVPIYQQLANSIRASIKSGKMPAGTRLPTVRELADMLQVAQGTVKRTYDELESEQLIKKAQGRGTRLLPPSTAPFLRWRIWDFRSARSIYS